MTFRLEIELGNSTMQCGADMARALHALADRVSCYYGAPEGERMTIRDDNGNTVGYAAFKT